MSKRKRVDPIPEEFSTYEEMAEFWDSHDTMDYPEAFRAVKAETAFRRRYYEIEVEADVVEKLRARARRRGVTVKRLANDLLRRQLAPVV